MSVLEVKNIRKSFDGKKHVLDGISFSLEKGESVAVIGSSGSGKTTLLRCLNFLERPGEGEIWVNGEMIFNAADPSTQKESQIRRKRLHFGLVFQNFNLFPQYTAKENVMLASRLLAKEREDYRSRKKAILKEIEEEAEELLAQVGLREKTALYPHQLSGGQCQRVAIARAIIGNPEILLADEPTGNLDSRMGAEVMDILHRLNREDGRTIVMVTHNEEQARQTSRTIRFFDGRQVE